MDREEDAPDSSSASTGESGRPQLSRRRRSSGESSSQSPSSERSTRRREGARAAETSSKGGDEEAVSDASSGPGSGSADGTSSTYSSPLREPRLHYQITGYTSDGERMYKRIDDDMNILREYRTKDAAYRRKLGIYMLLLDHPCMIFTLSLSIVDRQTLLIIKIQTFASRHWFLTHPSAYLLVGRRMKLPTLDMKIPFSFLDKEKLVLVRATTTKTILRAAKSVLALSSSIGIYKYISCRSLCCLAALRKLLLSANVCVHLQVIGNYHGVLASLLSGMQRGDEALW
jgi:hypothetical protein